MTFSSNAIYFYCVVPKDRSTDVNKDFVIRSNSICDIIFLQRILKFQADIYIGHDNWKIAADDIIDVEQACRSMEFNNDGKIVFDEIMKKFHVNLGLFYGMNMTIRTYEQYYKQFYDAYYNSLSKAKRKAPPAAMYYNAFTKTVNEYINIEKRHGNLTLVPQK
jgi:hypothetical protein